MKKFKFLLFFVLFTVSTLMTAPPAKADAILITMKGDRGTGHTSIISQDENGKWHYFFWGDKKAFDDTVPPNAMENINKFNEWLFSKRKEHPGIPSYYTRATYIYGDFIKSTQYYQSQVTNHECNKQSQGPADKSIKYNILLNPCSVVSSQALNHGILPNGETFQDLINAHRGILDWLPFYDYFPVNLHNLVDRALKEYDPYKKWWSTDWGKVTLEKILGRIEHAGSGSSIV